MHRNVKHVINNDIIVINVEYRLAPENRSPAGAKDMIAAIHYFKDNADKYGIDDTKLVLGGGSGGGYTAMVAAMLISEEPIAPPLKMLVLVCPMLGRTLDEAPSHEVPEWEKPWINCIPWSLLVDDFEQKHKDRNPILYPFEISMENAKKLPKTVMITSEFCMLRRDTHQLIPKLKEAGVYLDHADYAGSTHGQFGFHPEDPAFQLFDKDMKKVFDYAKKEEVEILKKNTLKDKMATLKYKKTEEESDGLMTDDEKA